MITTTIMTSISEKPGGADIPVCLRMMARILCGCAAGQAGMPPPPTCLAWRSEKPRLLNRIPRLQYGQHRRHHDEQHDHRQQDDQQRLEHRGEALGGAVDLL